MFVSVVIPTHDRRALVLRAVEALLRQDYPRAQYEVIVACDRCTDGTETALRNRFGDEVRVMAAENPGQTGALNTGIAAARGELAIFIDDELEASPRFIAEHVAAHASAGEKTAVVGYFTPDVRADSDPVVAYLAQGYEDFFRELALPSHETSPADLCGTNFSVRLRGLREARGFNQSYFFARNDFELAARLLQSGYSFRFAPRACGTLHIGETGDLLVSRAAQWARNDCRLAREYPWCVRHLAVFQVMQRERTRKAWRMVWLLGRPCASLLSALRRLFPRSLRWIRWEYAVRYALGVRDEVTGWRELSELCGGFR